jgi:FG-GAP repeat
VRVWSVAGSSLAELGGFFAYHPAFPGGVSVAVGDVTGDGVGDLITGAGPGGGPHVRVWSLVGSDLVEVAGFFAYDPAFPGGVFVAAGDVTGDGVAELITGAGPGGGPHVRVWSLTPAGIVEVTGFFAYNPAFPGGVRVGR